MKAEERGLLQGRGGQGIEGRRGERATLKTKVCVKIQNEANYAPSERTDF